MYDFIFGVLPTRANAAGSSLLGACGMVIAYLFGGWSASLEALVVAMAIDYLTGVLAAYINPHLKLDSRIGFKGIGKKLMILALVSLAHFLDRATGQEIISLIVTWFYFGNEGLSIIENAAKAGVPVPEKLKESLKQLHEEEREP
ncbi:phage holin family protein [Selenomonas sp. AB3002]|jgi:toxin secretion/phage lysis holin|uniref:phage holin family protein n=1 Tax=Selenomonas sp. AB3002 TaxID=1392502 RepID=UPI00068BDD7D